AEPETARALGLRAGARIVLMERLGFADDRPVCLSAHHFPAARLPGLLAALGEVRTITAALRLAGVADYRRKVTRVSARMPGADEARLLRMPHARPLLVCENVNVDSEGRVIEFCIARYPTPHVQIVCAP
ncbi:MAG TPA: UTRA domain-containing protein, partial [Acetobacteraceae bacterium]|nr:UTRA domain-containing protein [Acetobacteraceae bacterium]